MAKRAACTARACVHFNKIPHNLHSSYACETIKARLRVMITCAQHSFGILPFGVMFQTLPLSFHALEGMGTRLGGPLVVIDKKPSLWLLILWNVRGAIALI